MKFIKKLFLLLASLAIVACGQTKINPTNEAKLKVYTSIFPIHDLTKKIAGDKIQVEQLIPDGLSIHDFEPTTQDIVNLEKADMLIINGNGIEGWLEDINKSIENDLIICDSGQGIELIEGHIHNHGEYEDHGNHEHSHEDHGHGEQDHSHEDHGHEHSGPDGHTWSSPLNAKKQLENIKNSLVELDPENADYYEENFDKTVAEFDKLDQEFKEAVSSLSSKDLIVSHEAFGYLARDYGLSQIGIEALLPQSEPSPKKMAEIIDFISENNVKAIYFESTASTKVADTIAKECQVEVLSLNTLGTITEEDKEAGADYFSLMRENIEAIKKGLK